MSHILPLLNASSSRCSRSASAKRKSSPYAQKAAPTCTLSLTSVSVSAHGSSDLLNFIPFPSAPASVPFPSVAAPTSASTSPTKPTLTRPRIRTQASPLRRRRSLARLMQPTVPSSSPAESEQELVLPSPPRKRARKANTSSSSTPPATSSHHSLTPSSPSQRTTKASKKAAADLRFLCMMYRSIARMRILRELSEASRCLMKAPDAMDIDAAPPRVSCLDAQESLFTSRLRSYLIFNEMDPRWLDVIPLPSDSFSPEGNMDTEAPHSRPTCVPTPPQPPIFTPEQVTALLLFRFRHRSKCKSRPEALLGVQAPLKVRKRSPLAGPEILCVAEQCT